MSKMFAVILVLALVSLAFSMSCAADAYRKACASCPFDENGKTDKSCSGGYQASGTACISAAYPIMAGKYASGECPAVDACASELSSCVAQYSSGNDRADCQEGSVAICYAAADQCTQQAAVKCGEIENPCKAPSFIMLLLLAGAAFYSRKK
ncbi:MAG: hypothetical protein PHV13_00505 [Candidatus ainarchaeum sp.]|nr:hypothetical protein [Candidatus ainarchaeum sp.]